MPAPINKESDVLEKSIIKQLVAVVGEAAVLTTTEDTGPYAVDWRRRYHGRPLAVVKPASTVEVAAVVKLCADNRVAVVPQGGNTGLVGGATPDESGTQVIVNLSRMNRIRGLDLVNNTLTAEAGCVLATLQQAARDSDRLFPLSLAAEGSCEIGGNLSTNAGGTAVLRYGNTRELVLGLEVVLPNGEVWEGLRGLRKDNTGYDLKQLFIGAEGTLGIVTAAVLKLFPLPKGRATAIVACETPRQALALLSHLQANCGERLTGFELFSDYCLGLVLKHFPASQAPFAARFAQYALVELTDTLSADRVQSVLEEALAAALERHMIKDAAIAANESQCRQFWGIRERIPESEAAEGRNVKHDVSLPISHIAEFIEAAEASLVRRLPGIRMVTFGHLGDGNLHYNVSLPQGMSPDAFTGVADELSRIVHDHAARLGGSISAEHGLGQMKREEITHYKSAIEINLMKRIKAALDPDGIMNPGKVI